MLESLPPPAVPSTEQLLAEAQKKGKCWIDRGLTKSPLHGLDWRSLAEYAVQHDAW